MRQYTIDGRSVYSTFDEAQLPMTWIRVDEHLPAYGHIVLVKWDHSGHKYLARLLKDGRWYAAKSYAELLTPTHWMELPE